MFLKILLNLFFSVVMLKLEFPNALYLVQFEQAVSNLLTKGFIHPTMIYYIFNLNYACIIYYGYLYPFFSGLFLEVTIRPVEISHYLSLAADHLSLCSFKAPYLSFPYQLLFYSWSPVTKDRRLVIYPANSRKKPNKQWVLIIEFMCN